MSVTYSQLMSMSDQQTKVADAAAQRALAERQRKQETERREQLAREKREREMETRMRQKRFEEEARTKERQLQKEQEKLARERAMIQREAVKMDQLLHGKKRAKSEQSQRSSKGEGSERSYSSHRGNRSSGSPEPGHGTSNTLTREELREQKRQAEMKRVFSTTSGHKSRSSTPSTPNKHRSGGQLRGGAVNKITSTPGLPTLDPSSAHGQSAKERIAAVPLMLTKLNTVKRDLRTIDEIIQDRDRERKARGEVKVIAGDEAKEFSDWFGKSKKKGGSTLTAASSVASTTTTAPTPPGTPGAPTPSTNSSKDVDTRYKNSLPTPSSSQNREAASVAKHISTLQTSANAHSSGSIAKTVQSNSNHLSSNSKLSSSSSSMKPAIKAPTFSRLSESTGGSRHSTSKAPTSSTSSHKKRPRSPSMSPEPPRRKAPTSDCRPKSYLPDDIYSIITGGRSRAQYSKYDLDSDESDMEADLFDQEEEELRSARIAKKEDEAALEDLKRHEEEKRRKKLLREKSGRD